MSDDALIASLRSLARFEHSDLSIGDEAADALEVARVIDEERAHFVRRCLHAEGRLRIATQALEIIAGKRQCLDNLMGNQDVADEATRLIAVPDDGEPLPDSLVARDATTAADGEDTSAAYAYAVRLFSALAPQCEPLPNLIGVLTQIDNATTVIPPMRATIADHERALRAIVRAGSLAKAHRIAGNALARLLDKGTAAKPPTFAGSSVGRHECPTCDGGGEVAPDFECPDCDGTGYCVPLKEEAP